MSTDLPSGPSSDPAIDHDRHGPAVDPAIDATGDRVIDTKAGRILDPTAEPARSSAVVARRTALGLAVAMVISIPFAILLVLVRTKSEALERLDVGVADGLNAWVGEKPLTVDVLHVISTVSAPWVLRAAALVVAIVLWRRSRRVAAIWLAVTLTIGGLLGLVLKLLVERARPEFDEPVAVASGYSFPSGHALNSMLFAAAMLVLAFLFARGRIPAWAWAAAAAGVAIVGLDRISLGVHYVSDVVAGWVVALATVAATTLSFGLTQRGRFVTATSGNTAIMATPTTDGTRAGRDPEPSPSPRRPLVSAPPLAPTSPSAGWGGTFGHLAARLVPGWIAIWAIIVGIGLLLTGPLEGHWPLTVEDDINSGLEDARTSVWNTITYLMGWMGATAIVVGSALIAAIVFRVRLKRWAESVFILAAPLGQSIVFFFTQILITRDRPDVERLDDSPPTSSFPSGHSSAAMALWWGLALLLHRLMRPGWRRNAVLIVLALIPIGVIAARLYRGMHHPTDVVASIVNASLILVLTWKVVRGTTFPEVEGAPHDRAVDADAGRDAALGGTR